MTHKAELLHFRLRWVGVGGMSFREMYRYSAWPSAVLKSVFDFFRFEMGDFFLSTFL